MSGSEVLTVGQSQAADELAARAGVPVLQLMEAAGGAVARAVVAQWQPCRTVVLCGPGNNGGDGFVVARLLAARGWPVQVLLQGDRKRLSEAAGINADRWSGPIKPAIPANLEGAELVIDGLFGAGLTRPLAGKAAAVIEAVNGAGVDCVAIDLPSGIAGDSGDVLGVAPKCVLTITFFRPKPAHFLFPGRGLMGRVVVADIGLPDAVLDEIRPQTICNQPDQWRWAFPVPGAASHKYTRGHLLVAGGSHMTGAGRLCTRGARRIGAGLVTVATQAAGALIYALDQPGCIVREIEVAEDLSDLVADGRFTAVLIGPGSGRQDGVVASVLRLADSGLPLVLDADGLSVFGGQGAALFGRLPPVAVLTPHEGEFARLFEGIVDPKLDKLTRAKAAAKAAGAVILLKGADTVIAAPDGRAALMAVAPPWLATGGSGDVLAGMVAGLLAQGMPAFEAAQAAAWLHAAAAGEVGPGLIAEDLPDALPAVLRRHLFAHLPTAWPES